MNKKFGIVVGIIFLTMGMFSLISAFGVSTPYWDDNPLRIAPGESKTVVLGLQNGIGTEDITFEVELTSDGEGIATLVNKDSTYFVPLGGSNTIPIQIKVPEDARLSGVYQIGISLTQITSGEGGMVRLAGALTSRFPVEVVNEQESELYSPKEAKKGPSSLWIILIALVVALVIFAVAKKKKK